MKMLNLWNRLSRQKRYALLVKAYPERSWELHNHEAGLKWNALLPSTQEALNKMAKSHTPSGAAKEQPR
jgi:hypothetical protein